MSESFSILLNKMRELEQRKKLVSMGDWDIYHHSSRDKTTEYSIECFMKDMDEEFRIVWICECWVDQIQEGMKRKPRKVTAQEMMNLLSQM